MDPRDHADEQDALVIVGLHGKMGAGKNEAARRLAMLAPVPVVEVSFAAKLKQGSCQSLGDVYSDRWEEWKNNPNARVQVVVDGLVEIDISVREYWQFSGTEGGRNIFGQDVWVDAALPFGRDYSDAIHVVTDVRFANEARRVRQLGGVVVLVVGPHEDTGGHASEQALSNGYIDLVLDNTRRDDDFASLDAQLDALLNRLADLREIAA